MTIARREAETEARAVETCSTPDSTANRHA
jgi:hypothetical protein